MSAAHETMLELRDSGFDAVLWVLADTHANRDALAAGASIILPTSRSRLERPSEHLRLASIRAAQQ